MRFDRSKYKRFNYDEACEWGKKNYGDWMINIQSQEYKPKTPAEKFFRSYTQGIHHCYNRVLRSGDLDNYDFDDNIVISKDMFIESEKEIRNRQIDDNIFVYRYISKKFLELMKKWGNSSFGPIRRGTQLVERGYMSTTMSLESVENRNYANLRKNSMLIIYVPKGTNGVYVDLLSDMGENEIIFSPGVKLKVLNNYLFGKFIECELVNS